MASGAADKPSFRPRHQPYSTAWEMDGTAGPISHRG